MAPWDQHAQEVLLRRFSENSAIYSGQQKVGWRIEDFDYKKMKLFFVSLLWRASVSTQQFYKRITVGPYEERLRHMVLHSEPGSSEEFAVVLARFGEPDFMGMLDPHPEKFEGINYCRFYLCGFVAYIKVDRRPPPSSLRGLCMRENTPIIVIIRHLQNSKDGKVMKDIAMSIPARKN